MIFNKKNVLCTSLLAFVHLHAAEPSDFQQIQADQSIRQQQRDEALQKQIQPEVNVHLDQPKMSIPSQQLQYLSSHSESPCFDIKKILLQGEDAGHFLSAFNEITQGKNNIIGRCLGVKGLNQALDLVQNKIIADGYVTTRVLLPPQNIATGNIRIAPTL
ncbi:ShlB/FhaC/HecB family hemolysin secretion/activation protein [Acinetobacter sp. S40]|nr:ShlB/FhaC/HecB family hemolysin secretion/activation protein [Acinetobacter sp. S40]